MACHDVFLYQSQLAPNSQIGANSQIEACRIIGGVIKYSTGGTLLTVVPKLNGDLVSEVRERLMFPQPTTWPQELNDVEELWPAPASGENPHGDPIASDYVYMFATLVSASDICLKKIMVECVGSV